MNKVEKREKTIQSMVQTMRIIQTYGTMMSKTFEELTDGPALPGLDDEWMKKAKKQYMEADFTAGSINNALTKLGADILDYE